MRALIQRVSEASVTVDGVVSGKIGKGLLVFLGIRFDDNEARAEQLAGKIVQMRLFADSEGKMNRSLEDIAGEMLVVSQFTLYGDMRKGRRPSYAEAARPEEAFALYQYFVEKVRSKGFPVETGRFQAHMEVRLVNDGPVTIWCDSER
jgi:D-tyrosyl-tRNA(Tyr) deacylase